MSQGEVGSARTLPDPQVGLVSVLRPFPQFEDAYDTMSGARPIMFTEGGVILDAQAGKPGYDPHLLAGFPVPMGSRVIIWFPLARSDVLFGPYNWVLSWRLRNTHDFRNEHISYHYPKEGLGAPATGVNSGPRVVLPASMQSVVITSPGPRVGTYQLKDGTFAADAMNVTDYAIHELCVEAIQPKATRYQYSTQTGNANQGAMPLPPPFIDAKMPTHTQGVIEQGVVDLNNDQFGEQGMPMYLPFETYALGDELFIGCLKDQNASENQDRRTGAVWKPTWDFATINGSDSQFSRLFGQGKISPAATTPQLDVGIYIMVGVVT